MDGRPDALAEALVPMHLTPMGPLADGAALLDLPLSERLPELDFELPLAGGDEAEASQVSLASFAAVLREHLPEDDPMLAYADGLRRPTSATSSCAATSAAASTSVLRVGCGNRATWSWTTRPTGSAPPESR